MPEPEGPEHASVYVVTAAGLEALREGTVAVTASWRRLPATDLPSDVSTSCPLASSPDSLAPVFSGEDPRPRSSRSTQCTLPGWPSATESMLALSH